MIFFLSKYLVMVNKMENIENSDDRLSCKNYSAEKHWHRLTKTTLQRRWRCSRLAGEQGAEDGKRSSPGSPVRMALVEKDLDKVLRIFSK